VTIFKYPMEHVDEMKKDSLIFHLTYFNLNSFLAKNLMSYYDNVLILVTVFIERDLHLFILKFMLDLHRLLKLFLVNFNLIFYH
jgi:hypothetical protein